MYSTSEWIDIKLLGLISFDSEELRNKYKEIIAEAKQREKEFIIKAHLDGQSLGAFKKENSEIYYTNNFK